MFRRQKYLYRLFSAFFVTGLVPLALLSLFFGLFSSQVLKDSYRKQSERAVGNISREINTCLEDFSHIVYSLSMDGELIDFLDSDDSTEKNAVLYFYQKLYSALSGHIDDAAVHVIGINSPHSFSTQQVPVMYRSAPDDTADGIFVKAAAEPEKTVIELNTFTNDRGEGVCLTMCKTVKSPDSEAAGFVVLDIYKSYISTIADRANRGVFTELLLLDPTRNLVSDLYHPVNDGNFSSLPHLSKIPPFSTGMFTEKDRMTTYRPLQYNHISIAGTVPLDIILGNLSYLTRITLWFLLLCLLLSVILAVLISRSISRPVQELITHMAKVEKGQLDARINSSRKDEIGILFEKFDIMTERIQKLMAETLEEQSQLLTAERKALLAQINPHFLYNTLNTIKSISKLEGIESITTITTQLGKLLRSTIENDSEFVTLGESIELVKSYLAIQRIRFGDKITFTIKMENGLEKLPFPKLILQPLVENAVIHGLEPKLDPGEITVTCERENSQILITVADNGIGMDSIPDLDKTAGTACVGLHNIHRRLQLYYGQDYGISISSRIEKGTRISFRIPIAEGQNG